MPQRDQTPTNTIETWGVVQGTRVWIGGNNTEARREVELLIGDAERPPTGELDRAFIAPLGNEEAVYFARKLRSRLVPDGLIWVIYPKRGSTNEAIYSGNVDELNIELFEIGFAEWGRANLTAEYSSSGFRMDSGDGFADFSSLV